MNKLLCMVLLAMGLLTFCSNGRGGLFCEYDVKTLYHTVERGETLWDISEKYYHLEQKEQLNEFVWRVDRQNGKRRFIQPGDLVVIKYNVVKE